MYYFLILFCFCFCSCQLSSSQTKRPIPTPLYLWSLDSIQDVNTTTIPYDLLFFEDNNTFWRMNLEQDDYLIDSSGKYLRNKIFVNQHLKYTFWNIDSNNICLVPTNKPKRFYRKIQYSSPSDLNELLGARETNLKLSGSWLLTSSELSPTNIPSFCKKLYPKTKFLFRNGIMSVYPSQDSNIICGSYYYSLHDSLIAFSELDLRLELKILKVSSDSLILQSQYPPNYEDGDTIFRRDFLLLEKGYSLYFNRK